MYYGKINPLDIANGPGIRVSLFVSGCRNRCKGCFNPETWNFTYGKEFVGETLQELWRMLKDPNIEGLSILGGDPFEPENIDTVEGICILTKQLYPEKTIFVWTGYNFEDVMKSNVMNYIDVLVDGPFEEDKKDLRLRYRGSWNQRVIDVPKSLKAGCACRYDYEENPVEILRSNPSL